jgi:EAL domain-containing protein (putative c-di-GMP-specific phosphodiesterase class I)
LSYAAALAHIARHDDGTATGIWAGYTLRSAFQPIFAFRPGRLEIVAYEGLIRPFRAGLPVSPGDFFRSVPAGDRLTVETLTRTLHLLNAGTFLKPPAMLFVNFDPSVFIDRALAVAALRGMRLTLHEAGIDPRRVVCEVTEQRSASLPVLVSFVASLRDPGFRIAVDDYGAAESDMDRVAALRPDIVKFDAKWISRLMDTQAGFGLLKIMVREFASRGSGIVFEGIEDRRQLELAEKAGAEMVQGFALARPALMPVDFSAFAHIGADAGHKEPPGRDPHERSFGRRDKT